MSRPPARNPYQQPDDAPPAYEAVYASVPVVAGAPPDTTQIICPTCSILIALPAGMSLFQCPRCETECMAPPKAGDMPLDLPPPSFDSLQVTSKPPQKQDMGDTWLDEKGASRFQEKKGAVPEAKTLTPEEEQVQLHEKYLETDILYPGGSEVLCLRSFCLMNAPLFNFFWMGYYVCKTASRLKPRTDLDWSDTRMAKLGAFLGFVVFVIWEGFFISHAVHWRGKDLVLGLVFIFVGPLALVLCCWDIRILINQCNSGRPGSGGGGFSCEGGGAGGDALSCCGDCGMCDCAGCDGCDCGSCDCGGCDC